MATVSIDVAINSKGEAVISGISKGFDQAAAASDRANASFSAAQNVLQGMAQGLGQGIWSTLSSGISSAVGSLGSAVVAVGSLSEKFMNLQATSGNSLATIQGLGLVANITGVSLESIAGGMTKMQKNLAEGTAATQATLGGLGLTLQGLKSMEPAQAMDAILTRIQQIPDPAGRTAAAMALLGKSGAELLPVAGQLAELQAQAERLGITMSDQTVKSAANFDDALGLLEATGEGLWNQIAGAITTSESLHVVIGGLTEVVGQLSVWVKDNQATIREWVTTGILVAAEGLIGIASAAGVAIDAFTSIKVVVLGVQGIYETLGLAAIHLAEALMHPTTAVQVWDNFKVAVADAATRTEAAIGQAMQQNTSLQGSVSSVTGVIEAMRNKIVDSAGAHVSAAGAAQKHGDALKYVGAEALKAAEAEEKAAAARIKAAGDAASNRLAANLQDYEDNKVTSQYITVDDLTVKLDGYLAKWDKVREAEAKAKEELEASRASLYSLIGGAAELADALGAGGVASSMQSTVALMQQFDKATEDGVLGWGEIASIAASAIGAFKKATDSASGMSRALGGAMVGAGLGSKIGGLFGPIGSAIGAAAGGIIGAVAGIFHKPSWVQVGKDAGAILGEQIAPEMAKKLEETMKSQHVDLKGAISLNLGDIMSQGGKDARAYGSEILTVISQLAAGTIPAKEGIEQLSKAWDAVRASADAAGVVGDRTTVAILQSAKASGQLTAGMKDFLAGLADQAIAGADLIAQGFARIDPKDLELSNVGTEAAQFFAFGFEAEISKNGLVATLDKEGGKLRDFYQSLVDSGYIAGAAMLQPFIDLDAKLDDTSRGVLEVNTGIDQVFKSMADGGTLTQQQFQAMEDNMNATVAQLRAAGLSEADVWAAVSGPMHDMVSAGEQYGYQLDSNTQALRGQAEAAGQAFPVDPMLQMVDLLSVLVTTMGGTLPESVRQSGAAFDALGAGAAAAGNQIVTDMTGSVNEIDTTVQQMLDAATSGFQGLGQTATDQGDYMGVAWAGNLGEIMGFVDQLPTLADAFVTMADDSTEPVNELAAAAGLLAANMTGAAGAAAALGGTTYGSTPPYNPNGTGVPPTAPPQNARGGLYSPRSGGHLIQVAEGGSQELVAPVDALARSIGAGLGRELATGAPPRSSGGSGGGGIHITVNGSRDPRIVADEIAHVIRNQVQGSDGRSVTAVLDNRRR